jgi:excisionase family DNA binding protein
VDNTEITDLASLRASREAVLTRAETARVLRVDVRTVSRAIEAGDIPAVKVGRRILVPRERLLALLSDEVAA